MAQAEKKLFKDWFDQEAAKRLADQISSVYNDFDRKAFLKLATKDLQVLEMNARVKQFSDALRRVSPE